MSDAAEISPGSIAIDPETTGAEALAIALERSGLEVVFGLCGHTNVAVLAALEQSSVRFVGVHHEQMASHAADGYARLAGRPGVVLTHLGPGLTNALTGVANAALDGVPMLVISGNVQSYFFGQHAHMEATRHGDADQANSYAPFCKRIWRVDRADRLLPALAAALRTALTPPSGPVLVDVAMDVFSTAVGAGASWARVEAPAAPGLDDELAAAMAAELAAAQRPVLYAGVEVVQTRVGPLLATLAERLGAPIAYGLMGKGAVADSNPLVVGMTGLWGTPAANAACREADVLLALGTEFGELDSSSWQQGTTFSIPPTRLLHVNVDGAEIGRSYEPQIGAVAAAGPALQAILAHLPEPAAGSPELPAELTKLRGEFEARVGVERGADAFPLHPARVVAEVAGALGPDDVLVGDTGWNKNGIGQQVPVERPDQLVVPGGYATMGFGPAAALGAKLARPDAATVALVGDGAFLSNLSVVVTAVEEGLSVAWAVMNNGTYATISGMQRRHFDSDYGSMFDASRLDYVGFAEAVGAIGIRVETADGVGSAIAEAVAAGAPAVVDIPCGLDHVPVTGHWDINSLFAEDDEGR